MQLPKGGTQYIIKNNMYNLDCQIYIQHGVAKDMDDDAFTAVQDPYFSSLQEEDCH